MYEGSRETPKGSMEGGERAEGRRENVDRIVLRLMLCRVTVAMAGDRLRIRWSELISGESNSFRADRSAAERLSASEPDIGTTAQTG